MPMSATPREQRLTHGPVLPVLVAMALPNMLAMSAAAAVSIAETAYVGALGREALAAMAVVFPFAMLMQTLSGGAIGGAIASAVSRSIGAGDVDGAHALAWHATVICLVAGFAFALLFLLAGPALYRLLGAHDAVLDNAVRRRTGDLAVQCADLGGARQRRHAHAVAGDPGHHGAAGVDRRHA